MLVRKSIFNEIFVLQPWSEPIAIDSEATNARNIDEPCGSSDPKIVNVISVARLKKPMESSRNYVLSRYKNQRDQIVYTLTKAGHLKCREHDT